MLLSLITTFHTFFSFKKINLDVKRKDGEYFSTSNDKSFIFDDETLNLSANQWYLINLKISIKGKRTTVCRFYFDYGEGFCKQTPVEFSISSGSVKSNIFFTKQQPNRIQFQPLDSKGWFEVNCLTFTPINPFFAKKLMVKTLLKEQKKLTKKKLHNQLSLNASTLKTSFINSLLIEYQSIGRSNKKALEYKVLLPALEKRWFSNYKKPKKAISKLLNKPLISIVMPIDNLDGSFFECAFDSVLSQSYPHWELCISCNVENKNSLKELLHLKKLDKSKLQLIYLDEIEPAPKKSAVSLANGEFVTFFNQNDLLTQHALLSIVDEINNHPKTKLIYSDNDEICENNERLEPHFKSGWNPDLLYSHNYIGNMVVYDTKLFKHEQLKSPLGTNLDYDLLLRASTRISSEQIRHIPKILYHQRDSKNFKPDYNANLSSLKNHFKDVNNVTVTQGLSPRFFRVQYALPESEPLVSLLIPTRDHVDLISTCVESILEKTIYSNYEIIILDNSSQESATLSFFDKITRNPKVRIIKYKQAFNFSAINNFGASHAKGEILGFINNDIEVISPDWMTEIVSHVCRKEIGCVGAKLFYDNDTLQHAGVILGLGGVAGHSHKNFNRNDDGYLGRLKAVQNLSAVTAACLFLNKKTFEEVNGFDEENLAVAFNDVDLCLKVRQKGYRNIWTPFAELYHHESVSRGRLTNSVKRKKFTDEKKHMISKWKNILKADPYYNPNLTRTSEDFSIKK